MKLTSVRFATSRHTSPERIPQSIVYTIAATHPSGSVPDFDAKPAPSYYDTIHPTPHFVTSPHPAKQPQRSLFKRIFGPRDSNRHQSGITIDTTAAGDCIKHCHISELSGSPFSELPGDTVSELYSPIVGSPGSSATSPTPRYNKAFYNGTW